MAYALTLELPGKPDPRALRDAVIGVLRSNVYYLESQPMLPKTPRLDRTPSTTIRGCTRINGTATCAELVALEGAKHIVTLAREGYDLAEAGRTVQVQVGPDKNGDFHAELIIGGERVMFAEA
jgi:hypothetical protein